MTGARRHGWSRFCPKSLIGQMFLVLAVSLVLVHVVSLFVFSDERRFALQSLSQDETISRTASTLRVLDETPEELHDRILEAATSSRLRFWIGAESVVDDDHRRFASNWLAKRLRRQIDLPEGREVRVDVRDIGHDWFRRGRDDDGDDDDDGDWDDDDQDDRRWGHHHRPVSLLISVELGGGRWLNAENLFRSPPRERKWAAIGIMTLLVVGVSFASILLMRRITRPMKRLAAAANRLGRGEDGPPLVETGPAEARDTIHAFNEMRERLRRFIDDRTHMLAATSHDLRTPLTSLRLRAELVEDEDLRAKMLANLDEMQRMVSAMMAFAREDTVREDARDVDLRALIESIVGDLNDIGHPADLTAGDRIVLRCRPFALTRALRNLIENAARHGGGAKITAREAGQSVEIVIEDDGPGIPEDHLERVFDPFVRLDEARSQETGGMGLGLAIARSVIRSHGGEIAVANREEGGLRVVVTVPRA